MLKKSNWRKNDKMKKCFYYKGNMVDNFSNYMVDADGRFIIVWENVAKLKEALTEVANVEYVA